MATSGYTQPRKWRYNQTHSFPQSKPVTCKKELKTIFYNPSTSERAAGSCAHTVEAVLVEITQRSQRGAKPAVSLFTHQVGLTGLQHQRAPLEVHVHFTQLLQTAAGPMTHEHRSSHQEVIQTGGVNRHRRQVV